MQRPVVVLVLALLAGSVALWLTLAGGKPRPSRSAIPVGEPPSQESGERVTPGPAEDLEPIAGTRSGAATREVAAHGAGGLRIRVVDGPGGEPVAAAEVRFRGLAAQAALPDWTSGAAIEEAVAGRPIRQTDSDGLVSVSLSAEGGSTLVVARAGERFGFLILSTQPADAATPLLVLGPDRGLVARVVDPAGQPLPGVSVQLEAWVGRYWGRVRRVVTDATGSATFPHVQLTLEDRPEVERWRLALDVLHADPPEEVLDTGSIPTEPVVLVLDPGGHVVVEVVDPLGEPVVTGGDLELGIVAEGEARRLSIFNQRQRRSVRMAVGSATTHFHQVPLRHDLEVRFTTDATNVSTRMYLPGPASAGERIDVRLVMGSDHPVVRMRVLDGDGEPLTERSLLVGVDPGEGLISATGSVGTVTDEAGFCFAEFDPTWKVGRLQVREGLRSALIELDELLPPGLTDMGEVMLEPTPLVVSGRVVGSAGEPLVRAKVVLGIQEAGDQPSWRTLHQHFTRTDSEGEFELRGHISETSCRLEASYEGYVGTPTPFQRGATDVRVQLDAAGTIHASVLLPDGATATSVEMRVVPSANSSASLGAADGHHSRHGSGELATRPLPTGEYDVSVHLDALPDAVVLAEGVLVEPGVETRDPRLQDIDLRDVLQAFDITLEGIDEDRFDGEAHFGPTGGESLELSSWFYSSSFTLYAPFSSLDVDLHVPGYRQVSLREIRGDVHAAVQRGYPVRIALTGDAELPEPPHALSAALLPVAGNHSVDFHAPRFGPEREILVRCSVAGPARVHWLIEKSSAMGGSTSSRLAQPEQIVHVRDTEGEQRIEVVLSRGELERLMEEE